MFLFAIRRQGSELAYNFGFDGMIYGFWRIWLFMEEEEEGDFVYI